jgi:hypothetical protein
MRRSLLVALLCASGCSDNRVRGEVAGTRLEVKDAVFYVDSHDPHRPAQRLLVVLTDTPRACERSKAGEPERNETVVSLSLSRCDTSNQRHPLGAGTYDGRSCGDHPHSTNVASVAWRRTDAQGRETVHWEPDDAPASVELVAFQAVPGGRARGSFRAVLGEGRAVVEGDFNATFCDQRLGPPRYRAQTASATTSPASPPSGAQPPRGSGPGPKPTAKLPPPTP